jgi:hypothetical protein
MSEQISSMAYRNLSQPATKRHYIKSLGSFYEVSERYDYDDKLLKSDPKLIQMNL